MFRPRPVPSVNLVSCAYMFDEFCDDHHEAHSLKQIHRAVMVIGLCFITFAGYAITTRLGAAEPPTSITYGTQAADPSTTVFGD